MTAVNTGQVTTCLSDKQATIGSAFPYAMMPLSETTTVREQSATSPIHQLARNTTYEATAGPSGTYSVRVSKVTELEASRSDVISNNSTTFTYDAFNNIRSPN